MSIQRFSEFKTVESRSARRAHMAGGSNAHVHNYYLNSRCLLVSLEGEVRIVRI